MNLDRKTVDGFGDEWSRFDQSRLNETEAVKIFNKYFHVFPWSHINSRSVGFDLGCGSGRWAKFVSPKVKTLHLIDPSDAIEIAKINLAKFDNIIFHRASVDSFDIEDGSMDFGYSLGVLHHIPNTQEALKSCVRKLKKNAPFLIYLYYKLDGKPFWYKVLWRFSNIFRNVISICPYNIRYFLSQLIAFFAYFPLSRIAKLFELLGFNVNNFPLSSYKDYSLYTLRTDALDRFGTPLEQRFSKEEIKILMENSGLYEIKFSAIEPFWCAVGYKE